MTTPSTAGRTARRGAARACAAVVLGLLFLAGTFASASGMHGCPRHHHAPPASPGPAADATPGADPAADGSAQTTDPGGSDERDGTACTCLGDCQSGAPSALHPSPVRVVLHPEPPVASRPAADERPGSERRSDYFLPYPLGPPVG